LVPVLADENIPRTVVELLRAKGYDVKWVVEAGLQGADDNSLYKLAVEEQRVVISFDDYFAQRAHIDERHPLGVVILKFKPNNAQEVALLLNEALNIVGDLQGKLVIVQRTRIRVRRLG